MIWITRERGARDIRNKCKPKSHPPHHATARLAPRPDPHLATQGRSKKQLQPPTTANQDGDQVTSSLNQCIQQLRHHRQTRHPIHSSPRRGIQARVCQVLLSRLRGPSIMRRVRFRIPARQSTHMRHCRSRLGEAAGMRAEV